MIFFFCMGALFDFLRFSRELSYHAAILLAFRPEVQIIQFNCGWCVSCGSQSLPLSSKSCGPGFTLTEPASGIINARYSTVKQRLLGLLASVSWKAPGHRELEHRRCWLSGFIVSQFLVVRIFMFVGRSHRTSLKYYFHIYI